MERLPDLSGQTFLSYRLLRPIIAGGTAVIYLVRDVGDGNEYAMKILFPSEENRENYEREKAVFEILSLDPDCSEYVVCLREAFIHTIEMEEEGRIIDRISYYILVMELMTSDLYDLFYVRLRTFPNSYQLVSIMLRLLEGLKEIHRKDLAHNDIKLENLLYRSGPGDEIEDIKYGDLGFTCTDRFHFLETPVQRCNFYKGTPMHVSPEKARANLVGRGENEVSLEQAQKNDVWSLGVAFRLLANGTFPSRLATQVMFAPPEEEDPPLRVLFEAISRDPVEPLDYESEDPFLDALISTVIQRMNQRNPLERATAEEAWEYLHTSLIAGEYEF